MRVTRVVAVLALGAGLALPGMATAASGTSSAQTSGAQTATAQATTAPPVLPGVQGTSNPLTPGFPQPSVSVPTNTAPQVAPTTATTATAGSGSGFTGSSAIIIAIGALLVLGGIWMYIWRDARRRAPVRHRAGAAAALPGDDRRKGSKPRPKTRKLSQAERRRRKRGRAR